MVRIGRMRAKQLGIGCRPVHFLMFETLILPVQAGSQWGNSDFLDGTGDSEVISRLIDHFALAAAKPGQGLSELDVRIGTLHFWPPFEPIPGV